MATLTAGPVFADMKIAVVDLDGALQATDAAKKMSDALVVELKPKRDTLIQLKGQIEKLEEKFQKDQAIMSDKDKRDLKTQEQNLVSEFQQTQQDNEKTITDRRNALVQKMYPKLVAAMEELRKTGGYSIIFHKASAVTADPALDLTAKLTEKLNAANAAGK
jgi:outer membrane protein